MIVKPHVKLICGPLPLVPLVDVVFLLLVFFTISSSLVFWPGTKVETRVELPKAHTSGMSVADKLVITITRSELLFFNDNPVQWSELERLLKELVRSSRLASARRGGAAAVGDWRKGHRSPVVVLCADKSIPYGKVVEVMSLARSLNLAVYLVTDSIAADGTRLPGAGRGRLD